MGMQMHFAPALCERHLLRRCDVQVTEKDHAMIQQHLINRTKGRVIQVPRQIDAADFRTHAARERLDVELVESVELVEMLVEDDGKGIPEIERERIFDRGARLDTGKPGTGLGLAIVRDVAEIYDGSVTLEESEDLGGLLVRLRLPKAET